MKRGIISELFVSFGRMKEDERKHHFWIFFIVLVPIKQQHSSRKL
jgi:hypothetical protein